MQQTPNKSLTSVTDRDGRNPLTFAAGWGAMTTLKISPSSQLMAAEYLQLRNRRCLTSSTKQQCLAECQRKTVEDACRCSLEFMGPLLDRQTQYASACPVGSLEECWPNEGQSQTNRFRQCFEQCPLDSCIQWRYDIVQQLEYNFLVEATNEGSDSTAVDMGYLNVSIEMVKSSIHFMVIEELNDWSIDKVFDVIGGAVGFLLGVDVILIASVNAVLPLQKRTVNF